MERNQILDKREIFEFHFPLRGSRKKIVENENYLAVTSLCPLNSEKRKSDDDRKID
jgi:hypothetical protein